MLLVQPATGIAATVLTGRPFNLFGFSVPPVMAPHKEWADVAGSLHALGAYTLAGLVLVHAGAAILHRLVANDGVLDSMLPALRKKKGLIVAKAPKERARSPS